MEQIPNPTKAQQLKARNALKKLVPHLKEAKQAGVQLTPVQERILASLEPAAPPQ